MRKLLEFHRSPNAVKVRVALNYKDLDYVTEEMMAADRRPMIEAAGWPLIPILLDGDVVMRDSTAILHYLEANYRDRPSLTPRSRDDIRTAETLLANLGPEILRIQWSLQPEIEKAGEERDHERIAATRQDLVATLARLDARLSCEEWLVGGSMSMYDVLLACNLLPTRPPARFVEQSPIWQFFDAYVRLGDERPHVAAWVDRVAAYDAQTLH
ncbi:hypothetical protein BH18GEM1_BH18GEM1_10310 [soil metagenome]